MENTFTKKFSFWQFIKFIMPAIISMVFISLYTIIDGIFVSKLVGSDALASINIVLPIINLIFGIAIMFGTGGSAIISIKLGEKKGEEANKIFSMLMTIAFLVSSVLGVLAFIFIEDISIMLGATSKLIPYAVSYGGIIALFSSVFVIKSMLEFYIRTDGDFKFSLFISIIGGVLNIILDYYFIKTLNMGIAGAALATGLGALISALLGLFYFFTKKSTLKFRKPSFNFKVLRNVLINGSSEMVTELSTGITTLLFNMIALKYAGENGVAALTIILYAHFLLISTYLGFSAGVSPLISYNYGANNVAKVKETFKYSKIFLVVSSLLVFVASIAFAPNIVSIFVESSSEVFDLSLKGLYIFSFAFLFVGINVFTSGLFTALSNGKISSLISFLRAFIFVILGAFIFPPILKIDGLWTIVPFAELATLFVSLYFIKKYKRTYKL
ncbi:MAG: MATE family efflux transporter [Clostridium sp.]|uniref:MATE family efflux transporter n=1 Tax=Clostridium sp. TaxID=1506 RepID=UPI003F3B687B